MESESGVLQKTACLEHSMLSDSLIRMAGQASRGKAWCGEVWCGLLGLVGVRQEWLTKEM